MPYLTPDAKNQLSRTIRSLRDRLLTDLHNAAESTYRLSISKLDKAGLAEAPREQRRRLEDWLDEQVRAEAAPFTLKGDKLDKAKGEIRDRSLQNAIKLAAATLLNRLIVIRQVEALGLLRNKVVTGGWSSPAYREFRDFAPDLCNSYTEGYDFKYNTEGYGFLLSLLYDELALDLPGLFGQVGLTELFPIPASTLRAVVEALDALDPDTWRDDTTLGWVYQYWNDPEREALDDKLNSGGKVEPHEIASKTQMFTERYMVEWLLHNSLGQQWLAICQNNGWTPDVVADGTLDRLEERRKDWREKRDRGEVALDALMPIESEQEERWKYWVKQPPLTPLSSGRGAGGEGQSLQNADYSQLAGRNRQIPSALLEKAKQLRQEQTSAESLLWKCLRNRQLNNAKFRRQHNIGQIIADFYCHEAKLIIELDGGIHQQRQAEDRIRDEWAASNGIRVLRFPNKRVFDDVEEVLSEIAAALSPQPLTPSPQGEGRQEDGSTPLFPGRGAGGIDATAASRRVGKPMSASIRHLKILDPACGSGHFLIIAFGLLFAFYQEEARHRGETWTDRDIVEAILTHNLHGLDLDPRAVQIAAAAMYLKAKALCPQAELKVLNLVASNLNLAALPEDDPALVELRQEVTASTGIPEELTNQIVQGLKGADAWGSLLKVDDEVDRAIAEYEQQLYKQGELFAPDSEGAKDQETVDENAPAPREDKTTRDILIEKLERFLTLRTRGDDLGLRLRGEQLAAGVRFLRLVREDAYDLVIGNPPYQGTSKMKDAKYVAKHYKRAKADLYAAFLQRGLELAKPGGLSALLTMRNWMFISQYSDIREFLIDTYDLRVVGDLDRGAFDELAAGPGGVSVATSVFVCSKPREKHEAIALRPSPIGSVLHDLGKKKAAILSQIGRYQFEIQRFDGIKEKPIIYWWNEDFLENYSLTQKLEDVSPARFGVNTGNNTRFLRKSWEPSHFTIQSLRHPLSDQFPNSRIRWQRYVKGGADSPWIDPCNNLANWLFNGLEMKAYAEYLYRSYSRQIRNERYYFLPGVAFAKIGSNFSGRAHRFASIIDSAGSSVYPSNTSNVVCLFNSSIAKKVLESLNPTVNFQVGDVNRLPLFPIESADEIFANLDRAFTEHEAARETSVEFHQPGPSCWAYAQTWAQQAVDRPPGAPLPNWHPQYDQPPAVNWVSYAVGLALGRFPLSPHPLTPSPRAGEGGQETLPHGILYLSAYSGDRPDSKDTLSHPACQPLQTAWAEYGSAIVPGKTLRDWLRLNFFKDVHVSMYEQRPIYFPLSSERKNFVALITIHRWQDSTLTDLLAEYLVPEQAQLDGEIADLLGTKSQGDAKALASAEKRYTELMQLKTELDGFIQLVRQCAEVGPPPAKTSDPQPEVAAKYRMNLDDGVMINSAALWPLLDPQWNKPKKWWSELCTAKGRKDYDWAHLAARYFPQRVDAKCQSDPSLAVAHGCFWQYHPAKAYEWELRLQDEIGPDFTLDEANSATLRHQFETAHPQIVAELREKEEKRRERKYKKRAKDQLSLKV